MGLIRSFLAQLRTLANPPVNTQQDLDDLKVLGGRLLAAQLSRQDATDLKSFEFKVFSQFGEDGILQYLIRETAIRPDEEVFVEFGVENYTEANTRFLLINNNWRGLIIDGSEANISSIGKSDLVWRYDLTPRAAYITSENINALIGDGGIRGEIGLLSVDIDGNDYWVWKNISVVNPVIVVVEYNSVFGGRRAVTIPYEASFQRTRAHHSNLYWGASIAAFAHLAAAKGYALVGSNSAGNNAFFVRKDRMGRLRELTSQDAHVVSRFRDSRDSAGKLNFLSGSSRLAPIKDMPLLDIESGELIRVADLRENP